MGKSHRTDQCRYSDKEKVFTMRMGEMYLSEELMQEVGRKYNRKDKPIDLEP